MTRRGSGSTGSQGHSFSQIASAEIPRSTFDRSSTLKTAFFGGFLIPIFCDEILPGDTIKLKQRSFIRFSTPLVPVMDEIYVETQYFFVPLRIIWDLYPRFMGQQENPDDSIDFTVPTMTSAGGNTAAPLLSSYLGIPLNGTSITHSSLFHRAYIKIWNDWYRDANLQDKVVENSDAGPDLEADFGLQYRGKRKDMFTSCLPWPQRGDPISLLFDGIVPVTTTGDPVRLRDQSGNESTIDHTAAFFDIRPTGSPGTWDDGEELEFGTVTGLEADLTLASANTINGVRSAFAVQRLLERDARGGARLTEILYSHFKVRSADMRLQRPEYLGGSKVTIGIEQVAVTTQNGSANVGDVGGVAIGTGSSSAIMYSATEHGIIMGICSARAPLAYQQGLHKKFSRVTRYDYFWPAFSHIGEQPILNKEIYAQGTDDAAADAAVWGYNEAWAQYRYRPNEITGIMQSEALLSLDIWHLAQDFSSLPVLDATFIRDQPPFERVMAVELEEFLADFAFDIKHTRPIPTFSTPGLIDHF